MKQIISDKENNVQERITINELATILKKKKIYDIHEEAYLIDAFDIFSGLVYVEVKNQEGRLIGTNEFSNESLEYIEEQLKEATPSIKVVRAPSHFEDVTFLIEFIVEH